jgi:hypothetical protein
VRPIAPGLSLRHTPHMPKSTMPTHHRCRPPPPPAPNRAILVVPLCQPRCHPCMAMCRTRHRPLAPAYSGPRVILSRPCAGPGAAVSRAPLCWPQLHRPSSPLPLLSGPPPHWSGAHRPHRSSLCWLCTQELDPPPVVSLVR